MTGYIIKRQIKIVFFLFFSDKKGKISKEQRNDTSEEDEGPGTKTSLHLTVAIHSTKLLDSSNSLDFLKVV